MLVADHLAVRYGAVDAVRDVSLAVAPGQVLALLGPNGAGKTSTLAALSGIVAHDGSVTVDGCHVESPVAARAAGVVQLPEGRGLFGRLTVTQNLALAAYGRGRQAATAAVATAERLVPELAGWRGRRVATLSGGEQALVALGRLLAGEPRYALLDEPAVGLAPLAVDRLLGELDVLRDQGVGVLLVEQYAQRALALADRVVVLERGTVAYDGDPAGVGEPEALVRSYLAAPT